MRKYVYLVAFQALLGDVPLENLLVYDFFVREILSNLVFN